MQDIPVDPDAADRVAGIAAPGRAGTAAVSAAELQAADCRHGAGIVGGRSPRPGGAR